MLFTIELKVTGKLGMNAVYSGKHWSKREKGICEKCNYIKAARNKCKMSTEKPKSDGFDFMD